MLQDYHTIYTTALAILSAIITGGFVLIYVELSNKKTREIDSYEQLMRPFMHKLSAYFRYVSWCKSKIIIPKDNLLGGENEFKQVLDQLASYGSRAIMSGGDYRVNMFSAEQLYDISTNKINHLWYLTQHKHLCNLNWDTGNDIVNQYIYKELIEINPNYKDLPITLDNFIKVSSEFHTEIYQLYENDTRIHESKMWLWSHHTRFVTISFLSVLLSLSAMMMFQIPGWLIQIATILILLLLSISLLLVGIEYSKQIKWYNNIHKRVIENKEIMKKNVLFRLFEPLGLFLLLSAFCWQTISNEYRDQYEQTYQYEINNVLISTADLIASQAFMDTVNYKGYYITSCNPESVQKATSTLYANQVRIGNLYEKYRCYHWCQISL